MLRRTKIVTTLGPATDKPGVLESLIKAGADVVRLNFSHGNAEDHIKRAESVREIANRLGYHVAILGDLQGPKIRVARFLEGTVELEKGAAFILDAAFDGAAGTTERVGLDYKELPKDVERGDILLLDDGRIRLEVTAVSGSEVHTVVTVGGTLSNNKGINRMGGGLSAAALTDKDYRDIELAAEIDVDILAVSFPRSGADLQLARALLNKAGCDGAICAKIERAETVATDEALDDVILESDVVMVARGDLGVEIGDAQLVGKQKRIIQRARELNKVVITATQMMESMIDNSMPTRAEVMDVANAVLDGTDAVMLSAETAAGKYPVETVLAMAEICSGAEEYPALRLSRDRIEESVPSVSQATALAAMYTANHLEGVTAIIALTESGHTAKLMSRIHTDLPIFALSRHEHSLNRANLYRGVYPEYFDSTASDPQRVLRDAIELIEKRGHINKGEMVIITHGDVMETIGKTNTSKILQV
ncbi:pyruvate kinase [Aliidiomarina shirensis]|uniref:Pyruvate kinase n=1 Tax=Aliidiomarina shirensis TaxID=1048642 RepID=A0A432WX07_9GAMM|nr:pyruvate kinase [Aliidiomarina shirensis]RUO38318.1 pyruvate kinase [Aliidiomarina shirensis]